MKKYTSFAGLIMIVLLMTVSSSNSLAQDPIGITENKIVEREANFTLKFVGEDVMPINVTLHASYSTKENKCVLKFNKDTAITNYTYPLNLEYFNEQFNIDFNTHNNKNKDNIAKFNLHIISEQSIQSIFIWLYSMKSALDLDQPHTGVIHIRKNAMVFKDVDSEKLNARERAEKLDTLNERIVTKYRLMLKEKIKFQQELEYQILNLTNKINYDTSVINQEINFSKNTTVYNQSDRENVISGYEMKKKSLKDNVLNQYNTLKKIQKNIDFSEQNKEITKNILNNIVETKNSVESKSALDKHDAKAVITTLDDISKLYQTKMSEYIAEIKQISKEGVFPIKRVTIKIERGFIEDIHVEVENERGTTDWYDNIIPIGFSSMNNIKSLGRVKLFIRKDKRTNYNNYIYLSDVLGNYDINEELQTRDYAPADTVLNDIDPLVNPHIIFRRESRINLFESRIYSDLAGLDDKSPNGLLQIEVARRFNFLTNRLQYGGNRADWGCLNYLYIYGTLSKIDQKLRRLPLNNAYVVENNTIISPDYATNLNLRQYENASLGIDVNGLIHNYKDGKFIVYADAGIRYGHIPILDTVKMLNDNGDLVKPTIEDDIYKQAHTVTLSPKAKFEYISERRLGFTVSYQYNYSWLFSNNDFKQITSMTKSDLSDTRRERSSRQSHQFCFEVRILTGKMDNDNLFLRSRFFVQQGDANTFFSQIQIGYNYNLIFKK